MFYLTNALIPPRGTAGLLVSGPFSWAEVEPLVRRLQGRPDVISAIGHPATAELLGVPVSRGEVHPGPGDAALVVRLKRRAAAPGEDVQALDPDRDLEFRLVRYGPAACDNPLCLLQLGYHPDTFRFEPGGER